VAVVVVVMIRLAHQVVQAAAVGAVDSLAVLLHLDKVTQVVTETALMQQVVAVVQQEQEQPHLPMLAVQVEQRTLLILLGFQILLKVYQVQSQVAVVVVITTLLAALVVAVEQVMAQLVEYKVAMQ